MSFTASDGDSDAQASLVPVAKVSPATVSCWSGYQDFDCILICSPFVTLSGVYLHACTLGSGRLLLPYFLFSGTMADHKLRNRRGSQLAPIHPLQLLPPPLCWQQTGPRQRRLVRQADPQCVPEPPDPAAGHPGQQQVPLLRHQGQEDLPPLQSHGGGLSPLFRSVISRAQEGRGVSVRLLFYSGRRDKRNQRLLLQGEGPLWWAGPRGGLPPNPDQPTVPGHSGPGHHPRAWVDRVHSPPGGERVAHPAVRGTLQRPLHHSAGCHLCPQGEGVSN